ncbi:MAG: hypothetical protein PHI52_08845, partial [Bacteroidales bacterium]|nr:hypothetical protein [Bacteroidales bacterium]
MAQETDSLAMKKSNKLRRATVIKDTSLLTSPSDSLITSDSLPAASPSLKISNDAVSSPVDYYAKDSITFDLKNKKSFLYDDVKV